MKKWNKRKLILTSSALLCTALLLVGGTLAYLRTETPVVTNDFAPAIVNIAVVENGGAPIETGEGLRFDGTESINKSVKIMNLDKAEAPSTDAFIRVKLVAVLRNADGSNAGPVDVKYTLGDSENWKAEGGCYYYTVPVAPGESTGELLKSVEVANSEQIPDGGHIEIQVLADAIQARPDAAAAGEKENTPVMQAWGIYPPDLAQ